MFLFITAIILFIAAGIAYPLFKNDSILPAVGLALVGLIALVFASTTIVSTKNVGVVTTFGRPTDSLSNGLHVKAPWSKVTELDGAVQINHETSDVRLGNNSMAGVENSIQWRITPDKADQLFLDYRSFDSIKDNLVSRQITASLNEVFASYNPLEAVAIAKPGEAAVPAQPGIDLNKLSKLVEEDLRERVNGKVEIISVIIPLVRFDDQTQQKLDAFQQEIGNTRIAQQKELTAGAEAEANKALSASVNNDPNVLVSKCLDIVKSNNHSPLGCWPGTNTVIPAK
ncbi:lipoprotein [Rhodococcus phage Trina]|uniref:Band-7-like membrane protein n=1 Tax=Rhodococcus phage Trina TaxID=2027905 RepID=A0A2D0ZWQ3_9CAUD|nr:lipoprotein [Rhodococcus phage Trina]ASZ74943.1 band-7-like membrane protein [Rhodococcus phage Trina]